MTLQYEKIIKIIEEVFSEGFFNYFHTTYATDNKDSNEQMIEDLNLKIKDLKKRINDIRN